jgi:hypothetical protein
MRRRNHDDDTGLTDLHRAQPVYHRDAADGVLTCDFAADLGHFPDCHRFVAIVIESQGCTSTGIVTDYALEGYTGPVATAKQEGFEDPGIDRRAG